MPVAAKSAFAVSLFLAFSVGTAAAAGTRHYEAASTTAMGITGDMPLSDRSMVFEDGTKLQFSTSTMTKLLYDGKPVEATLYRLATPADPVFKGSGNDLCGEKVRYIAVWDAEDVGDTGIMMATFSGKNAPKSIDDEMCSSFWYIEK